MLNAGINVHRVLLSILASAALQLSQGPEQGDRLDIHVKELARASTLYHCIYHILLLGVAELVQVIIAVQDGTLSKATVAPR